MKNLFKVLIPLGFIAMTGCVVAPAPGYYRPYGYYHRAYYGPGVAVVAPAPVVVVRP